MYTYMWIFRQESHALEYAPIYMEIYVLQMLIIRKRIKKGLKKG